MARAIVLAPNFLSDHSFGQGYIHKMITIGTPHLGSPLATDLISDVGCVRNLLAENGMFTFNTVTFYAGFVNGAMGDLSAATTSQLSPELANLANQSPHPVPTALIAGTNPNFSALPPPLLGVLCAGEGDPLGGAVLGGIGGLFGGDPNDAIVSEASALDNTTPVIQDVFSGVVHTQGAVGVSKLGYEEPYELDDPAIATRVINLLNTPVTAGGASGGFYLVNP